MNHPRYTVSIRIGSCEILATCTVCGRFISCRRTWEDAEQLLQARCPCCNGALDMHHDTVFVAIEVDGKPEAMA